MTYSPAEASKILGMPQPTLRKYSRIFAEYLSFNPPGHWRSYTAADLVVIRKVSLRRLRGYGRKFEIVKETLEKPEDPTSKTDNPELPFSDQLRGMEEELAILLQMIQEAINKTDQLSKDYKIISRNFSTAIEGFQELESRLNRDIAYLEARKNKIDDLGERVVILEKLQSRSLVDKIVDLVDSFRA